MFTHLGTALLAILMFIGPCLAFAQSELEDEREIEELYDRDEKKAEAVRRRSRQKVKDVQSLSDLATLAPFSDIAVIQRRYLPKTGRFELTGGFHTNLNNPFFNAVGLNARAAYYLTERYAVEAMASFVANSNRQVTDDLEQERGITTDNVVTSNGFFGAAFKWNPIYGKITWLNKTIVPFDINFNLGGGVTSTTENEMAPTLHLGTSQVFALSKSMAFRWDLIWNLYQATETAANGVEKNVNQNDLFLGVGMSFYFPEATYR